MCFEVAVDATDEAHVAAESRYRDRGGRGGAAARNDTLCRDDAVIRIGMPREGVDRVPHHLSEILRRHLFQRLQVVRAAHFGAVG